jgi:hypothetical protein
MLVDGMPVMPMQKPQGGSTAQGEAK